MADRDVRLWGHLKNKVFIFPTAVYIAFNSPALQAELEQTVSLSLLSESFLLHFPAPVALFCPRGHSSLALAAACSFPHSHGAATCGSGFRLEEGTADPLDHSIGWFLFGVCLDLGRSGCRFDTTSPMPFEA